MSVLYPNLKNIVEKWLDKNAINIVRGLDVKSPDDLLIYEAESALWAPVSLRCNLRSHLSLRFRRRNLQAPVSLRNTFQALLSPRKPSVSYGPRFRAHCQAENFDFLSNFSPLTIWTKSLPASYATWHPYHDLDPENKTTRPRFSKICNPSLVV